MTYVLKFISGKYQGGEFLLEPDQEILIGRGSDLDMVLVEDMVSRRHARITSYGGEVMIEDMGSTNGSFVNGEKVQRSRLKEGDRILVGTSIIKLVAVDSPATETSEINELPDENYRPTDSTVASAPPQSGQTMTGLISGRIEEVALPDLLQLFSTSRKSGILSVHAHTEGRIYLKEGRAFYATLGNDHDIPAEKAFYRVLWWTTGTFVLEPPPAEWPEFPGDHLEHSTEGYIMEGMRQFDELNNIGDIPELASKVEVPTPLDTPLRALTPELLDTFQLALNYPTVEGVLNHSANNDTSTMQDLMYLLENSYLLTPEGTPSSKADTQP